MKNYFSFVIILLYFSNLASGQYLTNGWHSPSSTTSTTGIGTRAWSNTSKAITADGVYATSTAAVLGQVSNYLVLTGFNINLPSNAVVSGITVNIEKTFAGALGLITDSVISLVKNGAIIGNNKASKNAWVYPESTSTYGDNKDLWGTTWTVANINASNFGIAISARLGGVVALTTAEVDMVQLEVFYSVSLPVSLSDFTASVETDKVWLNWVTEEEIDNNYFIIERSINGIDFTAIDTIPGYGNSTTQRNYTAQDPAPQTGINYYRLKQVDMNGNYQYSTTISANNESEPANSIQVYPNPIQAGTLLTIKGSNHNQQVILIDMLGREYDSYKLESESVLSIPIPISLTSSFLLLLLRDELTGALTEKKICVTTRPF